MAALRAEIDAIDTACLDLLAKRAACIERAADLKRANGLPPRTRDRVAEVVANVRAGAEDRALDPDLIERIWRELIDAAIAEEARHLPCPPGMADWD